jgi:hypothetical protein
MMRNQIRLRIITATIIMKMMATKHIAANTDPRIIIGLNSLLLSIESGFLVLSLIFLLILVKIQNMKNETLVKY